MHQKPQKKILLLASVKNPKQNKDFFSFWQTLSLKSKSLTQSPIILSGCKKKCIKQLCTKLNSDWSKTIFNLQVNPSLAKKEVSQAFFTCNCTFKRGTEVLDSLNSLIMAGDICWAKQWTIFGTKMLIYKLRNT